MKVDSTKVCPVELAGSLDNSLRRFLQKPHKLLKPYIKEGMTVLDIGCGPGFFSVEIAKLLNGSGKVIAADLQSGMLDKISNKIKGTYIEPIVELHKCEIDRIGLNQKVDFVLAFYMIHEVIDQNSLFSELRSLLKPEGKILIVEPKFHVTKKSFAKMLEIIDHNELALVDMPKITLSRTLLLCAK